MKTPFTAPRRTVAVDFLYLDLETCGRCRGTGASLEQALDAVTGLLQAAGTEVKLRKVLIDSEEKALAERFISSPTIRVDGVDIALDFRESRCEAEACSCGDGNVDCRVWVYQGKEYTEAPVPMVIDAVLGAARGEPSGTAIGPYVLPDNLRRFFRNRGSAQSLADEAPAGTAACCSHEEQLACCEPSQKDACCGPAGAGAEGGCGCR